MSSRLVVPSAARQSVAVARHVATLQTEGHHVVFVTALLPARALARDFVAEGVDLDRVTVIDAATPHDKMDPVEGMDCMFLGSASLLELISLRVERVCSTVESPRAIICCLDALCTYNDETSVEQFVHYITSRLQSRGVGVDHVAMDDKTNLARRVSGFVEEHLKIVAKS